MAANMMTKQALFVASPAACFRQTKPVAARSRSSLVVRSQPPQTAPDKTVTPDEILACENNTSCGAKASCWASVTDLLG